MAITIIDTARRTLQTLWGDTGSGSPARAADSYELINRAGIGWDPTAKIASTHELLTVTPFQGSDAKDLPAAPLLFDVP